MRNIFLTILFSIFTITSFAQELKNPTMRDPFIENSGNFLVLTVFDRIGKSAITIDDVTKLQQELTNARKLITEQQKAINELKKSVDGLMKKVEDLQKIK